MRSTTELILLEKFGRISHILQHCVLWRRLKNENMRFNIIFHRIFNFFKILRSWGRLGNWFLNPIWVKSSPLTLTIRDTFSCLRLLNWICCRSVFSGETWVGKRQKSIIISMTVKRQGMVNLCLDGSSTYTQNTKISFQISKSNVG